MIDLLAQKHINYEQAQRTFTNIQEHSNAKSVKLARVEAMREEADMTLMAITHTQTHTHIHIYTSTCT